MVDIPCAPLVGRETLTISMNKQNTPKTALLPSRRWRCRGRIGENVVMSESRASLQFDLDLEAVRLLHRSVSFHLEKWPGGPDPREQEALQAMKTLLTAALLEFSLDQDAQR